MSVLIDKGLLQQYPVDVCVLTKGDVIDIPTLERIMGKAPDDPKWNFAIMSLRSWIEKETRKRGERLIMKNKGGALVILTDEDAANYTKRHAKLGRKRFYRNHRRQLDVVVQNLTDETRRDHERSIICNGRMIASMQTAGRQLPEPKPHERSTPLLGKKELE